MDALLESWHNFCSIAPQLIKQSLTRSVMPLRKLGHYSVRTAQLEESTRFYVDVLGMRVGFRPPLDFPGAWLYQGEDESEYGVVHLIGTSGNGAGLAEYLGDKRVASEGTGALDHLAFLADDVDEFRRRLQRRGLRYVERVVPGLGLRQLFFPDPSGLTIEMNFPADEVRAPAAGDAPRQTV
jgi:catechol 2,3-dioxygenase-like lactoylglutathione lyase family enzyme